MGTALANFLAGITGIRKDALARSPHDRATAATLGALLLLTTAIAMTNASYALTQAFLGSPIAPYVGIGAGTLWAAAVFCIERFILSGMAKLDDQGNPVPRVRLAILTLVRIPLAGIIALTLSWPLILRLCAGPIERERRAEQREAVNKERAANAREAGLAGLQTNVGDWERAVSKQDERLRGEPDSYRHRSAAKAVQSEEAEYRATVTRNERSIAHARGEIARLRSLEQPTPVDLARIPVLSERIGSWQRQISQRESELAAARQEESAARREWVESERTKLAEYTAGLGTARQRADDTGAAVAARDAKDTAELERALAPSLINQYRVLRRIKKTPNHPDAGAVRTVEWALHLVFLILELTPIFAKATYRVIPLDHALSALEMEDRERVILTAIRNIACRQARHDAILKVDQAAVDSWTASQLKEIGGKRPFSSAQLKTLQEEHGELVA